MQRIWLAAAAALLTLASAPARAITLEQAMADPDWIGPPVERPYWGVDGRSLYYALKQAGSGVRDLHRIDLGSGKDIIVDPAAMAAADGLDAVYDRARTRAAFVRNGDIFIRELASGRLSQVTRTPQRESMPQFSADGRALHYRAGEDWFVHDIAAAVSAPAADLRLQKDPQDKQPDALEAQQLRYFATLRRLKADREARKRHADEFSKGDPSRAPLPFYLGDEVQLQGSSLSPDGRWLLVVTSPKGYDTGKRGKLQRFVTESGYEEQEEERTRVGRNDPAPQSLLLLDLRGHSQHALALDGLPGIHDDPLKAVREENERHRAQQADGAAKPRQRPGTRRAARARMSPRVPRPPRPPRPNRRCARCASSRAPRMAAVAASPGARMAASSRSRSARSTTRTAGSPASTWPRPRCAASTASPIRPGSTGTSTISAGPATAAACGTCPRSRATRSCISSSPAPGRWR